MTPPTALRFVGAMPDTAAARLDSQSVHLWRIEHTQSEHRVPLRRLLARYLALPEAAVELVEAAGGKPALPAMLARRPDGRRLEFNWSHSGGYALVALALDARVGVDIEQHLARPRALAIARRFFPKREADTLAQLADVARTNAFLDLWCAKEAVLKAAGVGLSFGLARLAFSRSGQGWHLASLDAALGRVDDWHLAGFTPAPGYHGAVAWRGEPRRLVAQFERTPHPPEPA